MKKILLLGSGELGKELTISLQRFGCYIIACDKYKNAPAMQVSQECEVFDMLNSNNLKKVIDKHQPDLIVPEIEAIDTESLEKFENILKVKNEEINSYKNKIDEDRVTLEEGDSVYLDDGKYYHAITPMTQGARVTIVSRWGNKTPDRGFDY